MRPVCAAMRREFDRRCNVSAHVPSSIVSIPSTRLVRADAGLPLPFLSAGAALSSTARDHHNPVAVQAQITQRARLCKSPGMIQARPYALDLHHLQIRGEARHTVRHGSTIVRSGLPRHQSTAPQLSACELGRRMQHRAPAHRNAGDPGRRPLCKAHSAAEQRTFTHTAQRSTHASSGRSTQVLRDVTFSTFHSSPLAIYPANVRCSTAPEPARNLRHRWSRVCPAAGNRAQAHSCARSDWQRSACIDHLKDTSTPVDGSGATYAAAHAAGSRQAALPPRPTTVKGQGGAAIERQGSSGTAAATSAGPQHIRPVRHESAGAEQLWLAGNQCSHAISLHASLLPAAHVRVRTTKRRSCEPNRNPATSSNQRAAAWQLLGDADIHLDARRCPANQLPAFGTSVAAGDGTLQTLHTTLGCARVHLNSSVQSRASKNLRHPDSPIHTHVEALMDATATMSWRLAAATALATCAACGTVMPCHSFCRLTRCAVQHLITPYMLRLLLNAHHVHFTVPKVFGVHLQSPGAQRRAATAH